MENIKQFFSWVWAHHKGFLTPVALFLAFAIGVPFAEGIDPIAASLVSITCIIAKTGIWFWLIIQFKKKAVQ